MIHAKIGGLALIKNRVKERFTSTQINDRKYTMAIAQIFIKTVLSKPVELQEEGYLEYMRKMRKKFPCRVKSKMKAIQKYTRKVEEMISEGEDWAEIEKGIAKLKRLDFKEFVKTTF